MQSLQNIKKNHHSLIKEFKYKPCIISYLGTKLYEGKFTGSAIERYYHEDYDTSKVLIDLVVSEDTHFLMTLEDNHYIEESIRFIKENGSIDNLDATQYCHLINLAISLPVLLTCESSDAISRVKAILEIESDINQDSDGDDSTAPLGTEGTQNDDAIKKETEVKFKIWESPHKQIDWLNNEDKYLKIEYIYDDKEKDIIIDFLLGKKDGTWQLYAGKKGSVSYDDDPMKDLKKTTFKEGLLAAIKFVTDFIKKVEDSPDDWNQFYVHQ